MKKSILILVTITVLLSSILFCTGCAGEKNDLVGEWSLKYTDGSSATIIFEEAEKGKLTGERSIIDVESGKWIKETFEVASIDELTSTMTLLIEDGTVEQTFYAASKDKLLIFGTVFTNPKKNIEPLHIGTYVLDGEITPLIGDVYIGMTREEVKKTDFYKNNSTFSDEFEVTNWPVQDAYGTGQFLYDDADKLLGIKFRIHFADATAVGDVRFKAEEMNNKLYGAKISDSPYTWTSGNLKVTQEADQGVWLTYKLS